MKDLNESLNIFIKTRYSLAEEDRVLNGLLVCLQEISRLSFSQFFIRMGIPFDQEGEIQIRDHIPVSPDSVIDAIITKPGKILIWIEAKVVENQFNDSEQISRYQKLLLAQKEPKKYLLLLSPDSKPPEIDHSIERVDGSFSLSWRSWEEVLSTLDSLPEASSPNNNQIAHFLITHFLSFLKELGLVLSNNNYSDGSRKELSSKLRFLFGNVASEKIFLHLYHHGRGHLREIARDHTIGIGETQRALNRLIKSQILSKRKEGNQVIYSFNNKHPLLPPILELIRITYNSIPQELRTKVFNPKYTKKV